LTYTHTFARRVYTRVSAAFIVVIKTTDSPTPTLVEEGSCRTQTCSHLLKPLPTFSAPSVDPVYDIVCHCLQIHAWQSLDLLPCSGQILRLISLSIIFLIVRHAACLEV